MALKDIWIDKVDGKDIVQAADINGIADAVIELEDALDRNTTIWQIDQDYSYISLGGVATAKDTQLTAIPNKTPKVNDYTIDKAGNFLQIFQVVPTTGYMGLGLTMVSLAAVDKRNITLGLHTDGLIYIFIDGVPTGNGIALPSGGVSGDVVGNVDSANNIVLLGNLADGTYTVKYEMNDGSVIDIGSLVLEGDAPDEPAYTNLADPTSDEWMEGYKISSSGVVEASAGTTLVNTIPCVKGDVVRVKGMTGIITGMYKGGTWYSRKTVNTSNFNSATNPTVIDGDYTEFEQSWADVTSLRMYGTLSGTAEDVIITVNQPIE